MDIKQAIAQVVSHQHLSHTNMVAVMNTIMSGAATPAQIGGFLVGLRIKGETIEEITAAATVMRELASRVELTGIPHTVDIVGTGGDSTTTFNISTASMFVAAAAGCNVAKHGNRAVSSNSGSADVLEAAGISLNLLPNQVTRCVRELGVGFMFAPAHHGAMRHAVGARRELGIRTIFNVLGPLTNPAQVNNHLIGVFSKELVPIIAEVLRSLGSDRALVVHGQDGVDEISISAPTYIAELRNGEIIQYNINPEDFGMSYAPRTALQVSSPQESLAVIHNVFANQLGPARDVVILNAGAAIYIAGMATSIAVGCAKAQAVLHSGAAKAKLQALVALTQKLTSEGTCEQYP